MSARGRYGKQLRTDWFRVLVDLQYMGHPHARVSKILDVPQGTLRAWKGGVEPAHNYGHSLLELWCEITGKDLKDRPMTWD